MEANPRVSDLDADEDEDLMLDESFGSLTQLNQLRLSNDLPTFALIPVFDLPELERLSIKVTDDEPGEAYALRLESTRLTKLDVRV